MLMKKPEKLWGYWAVDLYSSHQ